MDNQNTQNKQKTPVNNGKPAPAQRFQSPKQPYAIKVLEDALRKNEEELELWKPYIRRFSWMHSTKRSNVIPSPENETFKVVVAYKDYFGNEFVSDTFYFVVSPESVKNKYFKSIMHPQAEGNYSPCENRIAQLKEAIEILKATK